MGIALFMVGTRILAKAPKWKQSVWWDDVLVALATVIDSFNPILLNRLTWWPGVDDRKCRLQSHMYVSVTLRVTRY